MLQTIKIVHHDVIARSGGWRKNVNKQNRSQKFVVLLQKGGRVYFNSHWFYLECSAFKNNSSTSSF